MEINKLTQYSPNFGAIHLANKKVNFNNIETSIDIYKLQAQDESFIRNLKGTVKLNELMPSMKPYELEIWQKVLNIAIGNTNGSKITSYLALHNNKPCGIMNYRTDENKLFLDTICTFPPEKEKRVPFAGTVLMQTLFEDCIKNGFERIDLYAITNGPFSAVSKYLSMGFKIISGEDNLHVMRARKPNIELHLDKLAKIIKTTQYNQEKNLFEVTKS